MNLKNEINNSKNNMQVCYLSIRTTLEELEKHFENPNELYEIQSYRYDKDDLKNDEEYIFECTIKYEGKIIDTNKIYSFKTLENTLRKIIDKEQVREEFTL